MFLPLEEKTRMFAMFLQHQDKVVQNTATYSVFEPMRENTVFFDVFSTKGPKCNTTTGVFFTFITSGSQAIQSKTLVFAVF